MSRDILKRLADPTVIALCIEGAVWPRSLLSSTLIPDAWMGLVETHDGRRRFVPAGEDPRPASDDKLLLVRNRAITVPLEIDDCPANCGNAVSGACEVLVHWEARDDDLAALRRTLLSAPELTLGRLAEAFADAGGQTVLRTFIHSAPAAQLVREDLRAALLAALREQLKRFLFDCGMVVQRVAKLDLTSASLARREALQREAAQRVERIKAREMVEEAALAATRRRLDDLSDVLEQLKGAAAGDEKTQWHELLSALSPTDRSRLLENLWRITPDRAVASAVVVVTGNACLWLDPAEPDQIARRITLDGSLGGLRSVTFSPQKRWLLVGAASGVWALDADNGDVVRKFEVPGVEPPRTGFNAAVTTGERLYATHSQLGCWSWSLDDPADVKAILEPSGGVPQRIRAVVATDHGDVLFAADDCVQSYEPESGQLGVLSSAGSVIQCLAVLENKLFAGTVDGKLFRVDLQHPDDWWLVQQLPAAIESVEPRRWSDLIELVVPAGARGISGIYDEQRVATCLLESPTPIRRAWACDDVIVGLNELRDRLVIMNANLSERTGREAHIGRLTSQSIQDACLVVRHEGTEAPSQQATGRDEPTERQNDEGAPA